MQRRIIGIIGASNASDTALAMAREVGKRIADAGVVLVCGGLGGVMQAAAQGCCEAGGDVLGLLPGSSADEANRFVTIAVPTNVGHARNVIIAHTAEILIAIDGEYGTLSEAAIALKLGKRVLTLGNGLVLKGVEPMESAQSAVAVALRALNLLQEETVCPPI